MAAAITHAVLIANDLDGHLPSPVALPQRMIPRRGRHPMPRLDPLDLAARGGGGQRLVPVAIGLLEQRQLCAGLDLLPPHQNPHPGRPRLQPVTTAAVAQQPGDVGDLRVLARLAGGV